MSLVQKILKNIHVPEIFKILIFAINKDDQYTNILN